jgi:hypothetical protein
VAEDPFDDMDADAHRDREGDPFEHLDPEGGADGTPSVPDSESDSGAEERPDDDPFEYAADASAGDREGPRASDQSGGGGDESSGSRAGRSVDVAADAFGDVDVSRGDPFEESSGAFERVDVESVDPDAVWERFTESAEKADAAHASLGGEAVPEDAPETVEVPKGRFCQTCPHFTAPPEIECTHDGTEIHTFVGSDEVRVSNCPILRERRELGETYE